MRISDLLSKEPFGLILEQTLSLYWSQLLGTDVRVSWNDRSEHFIWRGNIYLNFFCTSSVNQSVFTNTIREYGFSRSILRKSFQSLYVNFAVRAPFRRLLSQVFFSVSESIPYADQQLIIGGRNRIRIIHPEAGLSYVIPKVGSSRRGFDREILLRNSWANSISPSFYGLNPNGTAFSEEYFVGTPANRLPKTLFASSRFAASEMLLHAVHRPTHRLIVVSHYLDELVSAISSRSSFVGLQARQLAQWAHKRFGMETIGLSMTHGDFQDGNIMVSKNVTKIIDWETACERSQFYDFATLCSGIRLSSNMFETWVNTLDNWLRHPEYIPDLLLPIDSPLSLVVHSIVWWLEELLFQLEESGLSTESELEFHNSHTLFSSFRVFSYLQSINI